MRLKGLNCVITGGSSGIGAATVRRFVAEGAEVLIADIAIDDANTLATELGDAVSAIKPQKPDPRTRRTPYGQL